MSDVYLFATKDDWLNVFQPVESAGPLLYVLSDTYPERNFLTFYAGADLPNLGRATSDAYISCQSFLVTDRRVQIRPRAVRARDGIERFYVDQLHNPDTVEITLGGVLTEGVLISGRVATVSESPASRALMRRFESTLRRHFIKIKAFLVGPGARGLLNGGWRLTTAAQSPRLYDLSEGP